MKEKIFIAGAGGIGRAAALILLESEHIDVSVIVGDASEENLKETVSWLKRGTAAHRDLDSVLMSRDGMTPELQTTLEESAVLLDCLPGSLAPRMSQYCVDYGLHYANLTEYVAETDEIKRIAKEADTGFVLQTGLAPGYIDILGVQLYERFCHQFKVEAAQGMHLRVGALSENTTNPHYYAFTWSPIGVATEYIKQSIIVRDHKRMEVASLSDTERLILRGIPYEADFTSGGIADLPEALGGKITNIDYKTLRYPGHYDWVRQQIQELDGNIDKLEDRMLEQIPMVDNDRVLLYAEVCGKDNHGILRSINVTKCIEPSQVGTHTLRAIQTTTAAPLVECARLLLSGKHKGVVTQSMIDASAFVNSPIVSYFYGSH